MGTMLAVPITRNITKIGQIQVMFYMSAPETVSTGKKYQVNYNSILYLQYSPHAYQTLDDWKSGQFAIRPTSLYQVVLFFNEVLKWFQFGDIYTEHNGRKVFNSKYDNLYAVTKRGYYDNGQLKATPGLIEVANETYEEGINLYINRESNLTRLTKMQVEQLFVLLRDFRFTDEALLSLELLKDSYCMDTVLTQEEFQKRREAMGFTMKGQKGN